MSTTVDHFSVMGMRFDLLAPADIGAVVASELRRMVVAKPPHGEAERIYEIRTATHRSDVHVVRIDGTSCELIDSASTLTAAAALVADDVHPWIAEQHPDLLFVHAGVVEYCGRAIVIPGRSHRGKSKLVSSMLQAGANYLSDEFAPLDRSGCVHPYPRHLSMRSADGSTLVSPDAFGAATIDEPIPVGAIVNTWYEPGAVFEPVRRQGAGAMLVLMDNALVARSRPAHTMAIVAALRPDVVVWRSPRGDSGAAAEVILAEVEAS